MPRNESPENTVMRDVPPGNQTGIYYIIVSGLPFASIWQFFKDWLRQSGCEVDHIEIFQRSTSGWIRLVGEENFELALHHLRTVPYNNRTLLYSDKNRNERVRIMELIDDPPPEPKLRGLVRSPRAGNRLWGHYAGGGLQGDQPSPQAAMSASSSSSSFAGVPTRVSPPGFEVSSRTSWSAGMVAPGGGGYSGAYRAPSQDEKSSGSPRRGEKKKSKSKSGSGSGSGSGSDDGKKRRGKDEGMAPPVIAHGTCYRPR